MKTTAGQPPIQACPECVRLGLVDPATYIPEPPDAQESAPKQSHRLTLILHRAAARVIAKAYAGYALQHPNTWLGRLIRAAWRAL